MPPENWCFDDKKVSFFLRHRVEVREWFFSFKKLHDEEWVKIVQKFCTIWKFSVKIYERKYSLNFRRFQRAITLNVVTYRKINMQFTVFILGGVCTVLCISFQTSLQSYVWRLLASTRTELLFIFSLWIFLNTSFYENYFHILLWLSAIWTWGSHCLIEPIF